MRKIKALKTVFWFMHGRAPSHVEVLTLYRIMTNRNIFDTPLFYLTID